MLQRADREELLKLARTTLAAHLEAKAVPEPDRSLPALLERKGAFVSLHRGPELRGCIGQIYPDAELCRIVQYCAVSAGCGDPRFSPVELAELPTLEFEISVLSPLRRIQNIEDIEVGVHGLYIVRDPRRGLLLPQVATENRWNRMQFLEHTCRKAGMEVSAWRDPRSTIYVFEAEVFSETGVMGAPAS